MDSGDNSGLGYVQRKNRTAKKKEIPPHTRSTATGATWADSELPSRMIARNMSFSAAGNEQVVTGVENYFLTAIFVENCMFSQANFKVPPPLGIASIEMVN